MYRSNRCFKRNVLLLLSMWIGVTVTQAQTNEKTHMFKVGIGYSRLPLEPLEEYALDLWYTPMSLLVSYEPKPFMRFTLSFGYSSKKDIISNSVTITTRQMVFGLGVSYLFQINLFRPYLGVRTGLVQSKQSNSVKYGGHLDVNSYFIQAVAGGEIAFFKQLHIGLEMAYQYASPKFYDYFLRPLYMIPQYPDAGFKFGSNILIHYSLPL